MSYNKSVTPHVGDDLSGAHNALVGDNFVFEAARLMIVLEEAPTRT